jgi:hypothetical protein
MQLPLRFSPYVDCANNSNKILVPEQVNGILTGGGHKAIVPGSLLASASLVSVETTQLSW